MGWGSVVALEQPAVVGGRPDHRQLADRPGEGRTPSLVSRTMALVAAARASDTLAGSSNTALTPRGSTHGDSKQPQAQLADEHRRTAASTADAGTRPRQAPPSAARRSSRGRAAPVSPAVIALIAASADRRRPVVAGEQRHGEVVGHHIRRSPAPRAEDR